MRRTTHRQQQREGIHEPAHRIGMRRRLPNWLRGSRQPDEVIGRHGMRRWWLLRTRWFAIYLHHSTEDDERLLHDHPAWNISIRLRGQLLEEIPHIWTPHQHLPPGRVSGDIWIHPTRCGGYIAFIDREPHVWVRRMPRIVFRRATGIHRLVVPDPERGCWTIWIRGRSDASPSGWGFYAPDRGWLPWREGAAYMAAEDENGSKETA